MKDSIEFFATGKDVFMVDPEGEVKRFDQFPLAVLARLRDEIETDQKVEEALKELAGTGINAIRQFVRCRYGAYNNQGDLVDGNLASEYVDCEKRGNCPHEGVICRSELTAREIEVTRLIANDLADKQIADRLQISPFTVANHRVNIERKLGLASKLGVVRFACLNQLNL
jgi:DNA-binding CsgD family transcriptional regulator